jgi:CubicO group peptidase (beta-lactamase class C family)
MPGMRTLRFALAAALAVLPAVLVAQSAAVATKPDVDAVFARFSTSTPGCAVGVAAPGSPILAKGYGMADLEHDVPIAADTILEAGSVSKQFTAAAVLLLARDGKLSIDDPVRKYIPELPDYGMPLLIRHMLNHTSGLRDWGSVAAIAGWPRTTRVYTHAHVLEIASRQQSLNFPPGARWSYSNTGFNLAAIIVARVSGMTFAEFTRERIFEPAGMTHTSWRDDHTRIVKNRAIAYDEDTRHRGTFTTDMPFENVHGNGGLLTTVGDLLKWNDQFARPTVADKAFVELRQQPGRFSDGRTHGYAFGLYVGKRQGLREVYQRIDRRIQRVSDPLSGSEVVSGRAVQRRDQRDDPRTPGGRSIFGDHRPAAGSGAQRRGHRRERRDVSKRSHRSGREREPRARIVAAWTPMDLRRPRRRERHRRVRLDRKL